MKKYIFFTISLFTLFCVFSQMPDVNSIFTEDEKKLVLDGEIINRMYLKNNTVDENTHLFIDIPESNYYDDKELETYEMITDDKAFIPYDLEERDILDFYNVLNDFSGLTGMEYYSRRVKDREQLILESYRVNEKGRKIDDEVYTEIKPYVKSYSAQVDNKFSKVKLGGPLRFRSEVFNEGSDFLLYNNCVQSIPFVSGKDEYQFITFFLYDEEQKGFFYYSLNVMRIKTEGFLKEGGLLTLRPTTFSNRLRAATVHIAELLGLDWNDKLNPWDEKLLKKGFYKNY